MSDITQRAENTVFSTRGYGDLRALLVTLAVVDGVPLSVTFSGSPQVSLANGMTLDDPLFVQQNSQPTVDIALLSSAVRAATNQTVDQTNLGYKGISIIFNITAVTAVQTVTPIIEIKDTLTGVYLPICQPAAGLGAINTYALLAYPGAANSLSATLTALIINGVPLGRTWRLRVVHSSGGNFTYSATGSYLL